VARGARLPVTAIDDCTRVRVLKIYDACTQSMAIRFVDEVVRHLPFRILVIQTDNGAEFQSKFHWHLDELGIRHVHIRPRTPRLNGKVERSHRVDDQEFYQLLDKNGISDDIRLFNDKLREWENYYNYHRPHSRLDGQTPYERLLAHGTVVGSVERSLIRCVIAQPGIVDAAPL
jgi:transposase InsO family protein